MPGWTYNFADGRTYLLDHLDLRFAADVARLFPSAVRPRPALWWWVAGSLLAVPLLWAWPGRRRPAAAHLGAALLLLAAAAVPAAAARLPTRTVQFEDPWVEKSGGNVFPRRWIIERTRYRGGWTLPEGGWARAPVVPDGDRVTVHLVAQYIENARGRPVRLALRAGAHRLAVWRLPPVRTVWSETTLGPFAWPAGAPLEVEVLPAGAGVPNGAVLDLAELDWR